jgi:glycosyltransferase involved in cell wall biosynthesis
MRAGVRKSNPGARLLDITRLISRVGRPLTGIDRAEFAYLKRLLSETIPLFCILRTPVGYVLLDQRGSKQIYDRLRGQQDWGSVDLIGRFSVSSSYSNETMRAFADCRRFSTARCRPTGLTKMLTAYLPKWTVYLNVGHSNLDVGTIRAIKSVPNMEFVAMVHDTIPLDYPLYQRKGTSERFRKKVSVIAKYADLVIANSRYTDRQFAKSCRTKSRIPPSIVAHLGVELFDPNPIVFERVNVSDRPYFVALGTIEPRKNHRLLLNIWKELVEELPKDTCPVLVIAGQRGWMNEDVFAELDVLSHPTSNIRECNDLTDGMVAALLARSQGLLFPSYAEGYGLPPLEAASLGVPVVCNDLDVYREVLEDIPIYLNVSDQYAWKEEIKTLARIQIQPMHASMTQTLPSWEAHFDKVLELI